jgi:hypothetical protein
MFYRLIVLFCLVSCKNTAPQDKIKTINSEVQDSALKSSVNINDTIAHNVSISRDTFINEKPSKSSLPTENSIANNSDRIIVKSKPSHKEQGVKLQNTENTKGDNVINTSPIIIPKVAASRNQTIV